MPPRAEPRAAAHPRVMGMMLGSEDFSLDLGGLPGEDLLLTPSLMVLHAAYRIDRGLDFKSEVSMAKHFVANALNRIVDRAIQVHGALGYSTDTPLAHMATQARWARFADGADEVHQWRIAQRAIEAYTKTGSVSPAAGDLPL